MPARPTHGLQRYLYLGMILWHVDEGWEALAEPHRDVSVHVDGKRLKALLEAAHRVKPEGAGVHPEIHAADLRQPQRADGHKACGVVMEREPGLSPRQVPGSCGEAKPRLPSQL